MIASSAEVRTRLKAVFPDLRHLWLSDRTYWLPTVSEVTEAATRHLQTIGMDWAPEIADCDDFALFLRAAVLRERAQKAYQIPPDERFPWPFGEAMASRLKGEEYDHALCLALCRDGVYLVDPERTQWWRAEKDNDRLFFVRI